MRLSRSARLAGMLALAIWAARLTAQTQSGGQEGTQLPALTTPAAAPTSDANHIDPQLLQNLMQLLAPEPVKGPNFTLNIVSVHSSVIGWVTVWTPSVSWRFDKHFAVSAELPWYWDTKNYVPVTVKGVTSYPLMSTEDVIGDFSLSGQASFNAGKLNYLLLVTGALPTGQSTFGLSANIPTYNFTHHVEYPVGRFALLAEAGEGDSTSLAADANTKKSYVAVGPVANFLAGADVLLPREMIFSANAYEQMPLGNQNIYGTVTKKVKGKNVTTQVLEGTGVAEDNGLQAELDLPLSAHVMLTGSYVRSLRQHTDTTGVGLIWFLRVPKRVRIP